MSRSFKIAVSETLRKVICAEDHVSSELELLDILPADQMADLLAEELVKEGFERKGDILERVDDDVVISVNAKTGVVSVRASAAEEVELDGQKEGYAYDDAGPGAEKVEEQLRGKLHQELEKDAKKETDRLQQELTDKLEAELVDLRKELDRAVNRATAEALKQKAAQMGQIKEMTEDPESGSLTIVVEV